MSAFPALKASRRPPRKSSPLRPTPIAINVSSSTSSEEEKVPDGKSGSLVSKQLGAGEQGAVTKSEEMLFTSNNMAKVCPHTFERQFL